MNGVVDAVRNRPLLALGATNAATAFIALWLHTRGQGGVRRWLARNAFRTVVGFFRVVAKDLVASEEKKIKDKTIAKVMSHIEGPRFQAIPQKGMPKAELVSLLQKSSAKETKWREGKISGTVYHSGAELADVICEAFRAFASSNPIHPDVFPTCRKMEAGAHRDARGSPRSRALHAPRATFSMRIITDSPPRRRGRQRWLPCAARSLGAGRMRRAL
jgi:hypothetical protein